MVPKGESAHSHTSPGEIVPVSTSVWATQARTGQVGTRRLRHSCPERPRVPLHPSARTHAQAATSSAKGTAPLRAVGKATTSRALARRGTFLLASCNSTIRRRAASGAMRAPRTGASPVPRGALPRCRPLGRLPGAPSPLSRHLERLPGGDERPLRPRQEDAARAEPGREPGRWVRGPDPRPRPARGADVPVRGRHRLGHLEAQRAAATHADASRAACEFGWKARIPFEEELSDTVGWFEGSRLSSPPPSGCLAFQRTREVFCASPPRKGATT